MKLISSLHGRALQLFVADEVRGDRNVYWPQFVELVNARYGFLKHSDLGTASEKGIKFENGRLLTDRHQIGIENLDIYNDGIVATGRNTSDAEVILNDAIEWGFEAFGLRRPQRVAPRTYTSWLVVDFEEPIARMFSKLEELRDLMATSFEQGHGVRLDFQMQRVAFNVDPLSVPPFTNTEFTIDRRGGSPYPLNRFFCTAPLRTEAHITLLERIEATLRAE